VRPSDYSQPFEITESVGNNALSYERRGPSPRIWVPSLIDGTLDDVTVGDRVAFEDFDEHDALRSCVGLANLVATTWAGVPAVVMDNHNHAFFFWAEANLRGAIQDEATVIHVDQHRDTRVPPEPGDGHLAEDAFAYTNFHLNVGNYIVPAQQLGLIGDIQMVTSAEALADRRFVSRRNKILNIDLDFFAPEMSYIDFDAAAEFISAHLATASLVTIATSPFFIDQPAAIDALRRLVSAARRST